LIPTSSWASNVLTCSHHLESASATFARRHLRQPFTTVEPKTLIDVGDLQRSSPPRIFLLRSSSLLRCLASNAGVRCPKQSVLRFVVRTTFDSPSRFIVSLVTAYSDFQSRIHADTFTDVLSSGMTKHADSCAKMLILTHPQPARKSEIFLLLTLSITEFIGQNFVSVSKVSIFVQNNLCFAS
jgi:hypothetical protein